MNPPQVLRVGIVAEGPSDCFVLEAVMRALHDAVEVERIRPDITLAAGWMGVRSWCRDYGPILETFMVGVTSRPLHLVVVHVDCSMAHNERADRPCPPAGDTADALRAVVVNRWLGRATLPPFVLVASPSRTTEAWVVATLLPPYRRLANLECENAAGNELVARGLLPRGKKPAARYQRLAEMVGRELAGVRRHCTQADRFCLEFDSAVRSLHS